MYINAITRNYIFTQKKLSTIPPVDSEITDKKFHTILWLQSIHFLLVTCCCLPRADLPFIPLLSLFFLISSTGSLTFSFMWVAGCNHTVGWNLDCCRGFFSTIVGLEHRALWPRKPEDKTIGTLSTGPCTSIGSMDRWNNMLNDKEIIHVYSMNYVNGRFKAYFR